MPESDGTPVKRGRPPLRVRLAVVAASAVVGLLIFELLLRAAGYSYPTFYMPDPVRGYALEPGAEGWYTREGRSYVRVNSDGLRDGEHAKAKPAGTLRIAVVGDSYAEAMHVAQEETFWSQLERRLGGCAALGGRGVEVLNFGVSGYGTAQELLTLRGKVWDYAPDVVLLAVTTGNDYTDNVRALQEADDVPYFVLRGDELVLDGSFRDGAKFRLRTSLLARAGRWLYANLRFMQAFQRARHALKAQLARRRQRMQAREERARLEAARARDGGGSEPPGGPAPPSADWDGLDNMVYFEPADEAWREAWRLTERLLVEMRRDVEARGARFFVATLSNPIQVHPDPSVRADFLRRMGPGADLFYPERRYRDLGRREGLTVFELAPGLQAYADEHRVFLHGWGGDPGKGHWNENGHRVAGELLAQRLCEQLARGGGGGDHEGGTTR